MSDFVARWYCVPICSPFPVWKYQAEFWDENDQPYGFRWVQDWYLTKRFESREAAEQFIQDNQLGGSSRWGQR